jgi:hypothetical protein
MHNSLRFVTAMGVGWASKSADAVVNQLALVQRAAHAV